MSLTNSMSVPFEIPEINHGLKEAHGLIRLCEGGVELEFEVQGALLGISKSGVRTERILYQYLEAIEFKKSWLHASIILEGTSMKVFEEIPGTEVATCRLQVKRKDRDEAESLVSKARLQLSEFQLNQMNEEND